jgi:hypothetical protein
MRSSNDIEYHDELVAVLETVWGEGFFSPGGRFVASDWMRRDANPPSADMRNYIKAEGLSFEMTPPEYYKTALKKAGFENIVLRDRNSWYAKLARKEYDRMKGPLYQTQYSHTPALPRIGKI